MPLYADWRHHHLPVAERPAEEGTHDASPARGGDNKDDHPLLTTPTTTTTSIIEKPFFFCPYDAGVEAELRALHARQRVHGDVQPEIDTLLAACAHPACVGVRLPRHMVPHYDNLPDISAYALGILDPAMDADPELQQVLLLLRQCTPLRRRTKRAQREVQWREGSCFPMQTLVRCMQGTLLGLYPNSLRAITFAARVAIYRFLRTLLVQPFGRLHAALNRIPYITKLSIMEHLCNTIYDYHPGICHTLNRSGQKIEHFCDSVSNICSIFRTELNTLFCAELPADGSAPGAEELERILFRVLPRLERTSHSFYERSTRAYRGIIIGAARPPRSLDLARRLLAAPQAPASSPAAPAATQAAMAHLAHARLAGNQTIFDLAHAASIPDPAMRELCWHLMQVVRVYPLPACVAAAQRAALRRRYGDSVRMRQCRVLHLCLQCIVRKGTAAGIRLRHDCLSDDDVVCMGCGPGTVVGIDMVGRIAHVAGEYLLLSSCCASFVFYGGSGFEFVAGACGAQCASPQQLFKKRDRSLSAAAAAAGSGAAGAASSRAPGSQGGGGSDGCLMCAARAGLMQTVTLLDPPRRAMATYALCARHAAPAHVVERARTRHDLERYFALRAEQQQLEAPGRAAGKKKKRLRCIS